MHSASNMADMIYIRSLYLSKPYLVCRKFEPEIVSLRENFFFLQKLKLTLFGKYQFKLNTKDNRTNLIHIALVSVLLPLNKCFYIW